MSTAGKKTQPGPGKKIPCGIKAGPKVECALLLNKELPEFQNGPGELNYQVQHFSEIKEFIQSPKW